MNRTPRPVPGSRRAAVANAYGAARRIEQAKIEARKKASAAAAMAQMAAGPVKKTKGPKRGPDGRFLPKNKD